jgi:tetratricopeptide (TPR) repeat protein
MKATNRNQQKYPWLLLAAVKRKLNNCIQSFIIKKAFLAVCLFLCFFISSQAQDFSFNAGQELAYRDALDFRPDEARRKLADDASPEAAYIISLADGLELLMTEDQDKFHRYETQFSQRTERESEGSAKWIFVQSELHLQWSFIYLKFGHELDAAMQLRKAFLLSRSLRSHYPNFTAGLKTSGLIHVMVGSVPDKYHWVLDLLNMEGDIDQGLSELTTLADSNHALSDEAMMLSAFIHGFMLQKPEKGLEVIQRLLTGSKSNGALFLGANLRLKNSDGEGALQLLQTLEKHVDGGALPYLRYLKGELLLYKGLYGEARKSFELFLSSYGGQNLVKDAHFKIGTCYLLEGNNTLAAKRFGIARNAGKEATEADRYAARALADDAPPSLFLTRARFFTDGGYYDEAMNVLRAESENNLTSQRDRVEFPYRKARLYHKINDRPNAILFYKKTIAASDDDSYYFAPNACLQLGYLYVDAQDFNEAKVYFEKALSYKRHEYKNSIDSKARSALAHLNDRK